MTAKILVSNNEYQEILKNEAVLYWKKVFAITEDQKQNGKLEALKSKYWKEMNEVLNQYEIEKFDPKLKNEALNKFIELYCNSNTITDDFTRYRGHTQADYISIEGCKQKFNTGYNQYLTCHSDLTVVEYCEGDLIVVVRCRICNEITDEMEDCEDFTVVQNNKL